jgi:transposase
MRYAGIDIAAETHVVAIVDVDGQVVHKATKFTEDAQGYAELLKVLGPTTDLQVGMEATGHYWQNVFGFLTAHDVAVTVINPLRTRRHAEENLARAKTDAIDAVGIARYLQEKKPAPTRLAEGTTLQLRELVRLRDRLVQDMVEKVQQLHRVIDLGFPEFTRLVTDVGSALATSLLERYGTAQGFAASRAGEIANLVYDGRRAIGRSLAGKLVQAAKTSVGRHHGHVYELQAKYACQDIRTLRERIKSLNTEIATTIDKDELAMLLKTIDGIGTNTSARIIAETGDPAQFASAGALAAYIGAVPHTRQSGKRKSDRASMTRIGHAGLRAKLWMPTLVAATRRNPWLMAFYDRLIARGKPAKVALVACMRKLIGAIYSVAKNRKPFVPMTTATTAPDAAAA